MTPDLPSLVHTLGLLPPMAPGLMEPVSWYRHRILDTQPWETRSCLEMTHGLMPWWAISTILCRMWLGKGLPFIKTPPSWFTRPWPSGVETILSEYEGGGERENVHHSYTTRHGELKFLLLPHAPEHTNNDILRLTGTK